jgi:hypothetical protein
MVSPPDVSWSQTTEAIPQQVYTPPPSLYQSPGVIRQQTYGSNPRPTPVLPYGQSYGTPLTGTGQMVIPQQANPPSTFDGQPLQPMTGNGFDQFNGQTPQQIMPQYPTYPQQQILPQQYPQQQMMQQQPGALSYGQQSILPMGQPSSMVQSVSMLESQVFGQTYTGSNLQQRLNNLEKNIFGTTYPKYSPQQRINRLMNKATPQSALPANPLSRLLGEKTASKGKKPGIMQSALGSLLQNQLLNTVQQPASYGVQTDAYGNPIDPYSAY